MNQQSTAEWYYSELANDPCLGELVELFLGDVPVRIAGLRAALAADDAVTLQRLAHQLKGALGGYGFDAVTGFAAELEAAMRDDAPPHRVEALTHSLCDACGRLRGGAAPPASRAD